MEKDNLEDKEEMDAPAVPDTLARKVTEGSAAPPACPLLRCEQSLWRKENLEPPAAAGFLASPGPEVIRVCPVCPVVRVCPDFLVTPSRVKVSRVSPGFRGDRVLQAFPDRREKLESLDSPARREEGVMMAHLVSLATLESLAGPVGKVNPEILTDTLELQVRRASREMQASQAAVATTAPPVTTVFQEAQVSPDKRGVLVKPDVRE